MTGAIIWLSIAATPAHVQQCTAYDITSATHPTFSCTLPQPTQGGNLLVVSCGYGSQDVTVTALANNSVGFVEAVRQYSSGKSQGLRLFYLANAPAGITAVTCAFASPADYVSILAHEYSGVATNNPLSATTTQLGNGPDVTTSVLLTPDAGHLLYGVAEDITSIAATFSAGAGFTLRAGLSGAVTADEDQIQAAGGPAIASFALFPDTDEWICQLAAFYPASGADPADAGTHDGRLGVACGCSNGGVLFFGLLALVLLSGGTRPKRCSG